MISTWSAEKQKKNPTGWKYIEILFAGCSFWKHVRSSNKYFKNTFKRKLTRAGIPENRPNR